MFIEGFVGRMDWLKDEQFPNGKESNIWVFSH